MPILTSAERIGTTLAGKYRLDRILGQGGMGTVFAGVHEWTSRQVAVKMLNADLAADDVTAQRFLQEARAAAGLEHPNVVDVLDMGQAEDGAVYLVLELLVGESLADQIVRGPMSVQATLSHLLPVIDALGSAHKHGIVHRDLKPDNIFLSITPQGRVIPKLLDFGIVKVAGDKATKTKVGFIVGTPEYMSPEQAQGKADIGPSSDVWSMGVVLFECLTGQLPFQAETQTGVLVAVVTQRAPSVRTLGVEVPRAIAAVVDRALSVEPEARFPDAAALGQALEDAARGIDPGDAVLAGREQSTDTAHRPRTRGLAATRAQDEDEPRAASDVGTAAKRRWVPLVAVAGVVLLVAAVAVAFNASRGGAQPGANRPGGATLIAATDPVGTPIHAGDARVLAAAPAHDTAEPRAAELADAGSTSAATGGGSAPPSIPFGKAPPPIERRATPLVGHSGPPRATRPHPVAQRGANGSPILD